MKANHINAICRATKTILQSHFGVDVQQQKPTVNIGSVSSNQVSVLLGVKGQLSGQIICSFSKDTAQKLVGIMMGGMEITTLDEMGWSAVQEFGNWVAGTTATELSKEECIIDVTPPIVNDGESQFRSKQTFISIPHQSPIGEIDIHISVVESVVA
ncbi:chemotaxis protein CheX [Alkalihalobacillus sp. LMS39]|uniref:chemotaxis protein CheX n=1 Tax=Alkalihalobacillus sp. LMS39 TaxID=2924032 RepID=UPI001FB40B90|nr:chemotaxis protein CheX [Alkalihalobacillus sp. LMS39]UOE95397.1 chemotaxis protein CheX [Alkalihalobacillus sp. LMS39]